MMMSCPLGVTFWHNEQVVELLEGDVGPPKAISSCARVFLHQTCAKSSSNHPTPPNPSPPSVTSCPRRVECGLQRQTLGKGRASESPPRDNQVPPKETSLIHVSKERGCIIQPVGFMPQMKVQVTLCLHDQAFTCQGPAKTNKYALQGSTSHNIMPSKPYLIK
jgi:hypothetical protein